MLLRLAVGLKTWGVTSHVINLGYPTSLVSLFEEKGIMVTSLRLTPSLGGFIKGIPRMRATLLGGGFDLVQAWMYHANMISALALTTRRHVIPLLWNVRRGLDDYHHRSFLTRAVIRSNIALSSIPKQIIYCSHESRRQHEERGFSPEQGCVLQNGFDTHRFRPDEERRRRFRLTHGFSNEEFVIGNVGRFEVVKGHAYLIEAFKLLVHRVPQARLVMVGRGVDHSNRAIVDPLREAGILSHVRLLGEQAALEEVYPGLDLYCQASLGEGFPNALAEAMACGLVCVATDTGASRELVHGLGAVVPRESAEVLAEAVFSLAQRNDEHRLQLGRSGRARIVQFYSLDRIIQEYLELYQKQCLSQRTAVEQLLAG